MPTGPARRVRASTAFAARDDPGTYRWRGSGTGLTRSRALG